MDEVWKDWHVDMFPVNHSPEVPDRGISEEAKRVGEGGVVVGFQYGWGGKEESGLWSHEPYWRLWDVEHDGVVDRMQEVRGGLPPALVALFPIIYRRDGYGRIPLAAFTREEWAALCRSDDGREP